MDDILWMFLELIANLIESFLCIHFIIVSFDGKCKIFGLKIVYIIGTIGFATIAISINQITKYEGILGLIYEAYFIVFSLIFLRGAWLKKLFISALMLVCIVSTAAVSGNILSALFKSEPTEIYTAHNFKRFTYMVIGTALLAYTFAIISRFTSGKKESLKVKEWVLIFSVLLISFLIIIALHITILECEIEDKYINLIVAAESGIVFINFICLYIYEKQLTGANACVLIICAICTNLTAKILLPKGFKSRQNLFCQDSENKKSPVNDLSRTRNYSQAIW